MERIPILQAQLEAMARQLNQRTLESLEYRILMKAVVAAHPDKRALSFCIQEQKNRLVEQGIIGNIVEGDREYLNEYLEKWLALCE
ncbi:MULTISPECIES: hypothetical protein [Methylobacillus]|uniref:Uncharacterized protein n=1 Tax=Methylobacillus flagellatus (strain ATCC 51484 / DSM 6875 / VKM B-1610 / KT) TaxID=265072 RepID=Q1H3K6_METFK|nr:MULTISPECIES: hypothetical protein [Methylobacillus]ABE48931.1 hypothetical protein Mfla_0661 [Methylobacillus flagellatus KT]MPS49561.1 hypothetical protein [Methylobacillus sp.]